ncbi:uncharacterized protein LOC134823857 [Bolinopsis microptera]|uniref:uncharacterized protein LOC134823857 n=1 Tax=Bolinopsis microptera TaxID=2820187 RepID=UPI00307AFD7B
MKQVVFILALVAVCHCNLFASETLLKLSDILKAMNLEEMVQSSTAHKFGASFFKYYSDDLLPLQFQLWKEHAGRDYESSEEHSERQGIWSKNVKLIHEHNQQNKSYSLAINHLGDLTHDEYKNMLLGTKINMKGKDANPLYGQQTNGESYNELPSQMISELKVKTKSKSKQRAKNPKQPAIVIPAIKGRQNEIIKVVMSVRKWEGVLSPSEVDAKSAADTVHLHRKMRNPPKQAEKESSPEKEEKTTIWHRT